MRYRCGLGWCCRSLRFCFDGLRGLSANLLSFWGLGFFRLGFFRLGFFNLSLRLCLGKLRLEQLATEVSDLTLQRVKPSARR